MRILMNGNGGGSSGTSEVQTETDNGSNEEMGAGITEGKSFKEVNKKKKGVSFNDRIYYDDGTSVTVDLQM